MTPDEVRMLDNKYALLFIRGERPILDDKYDILQHPNVALTTDGDAKEIPKVIKVIPKISNDLSRAYDIKNIEIMEVEI